MTSPFLVSLSRTGDGLRYNPLTFSGISERIQVRVIDRAVCMETYILWEWSCCLFHPTWWQRSNYLLLIWEGKWLSWTLLEEWLNSDLKSFTGDLASDFGVQSVFISLCLRQPNKNTSCLSLSNMITLILTYIVLIS